MKQATKLRRSFKWSEYISPDLIPKERSHNKKLRNELKAYKSSGEKDIYMTYGKIVSHPSYNSTPTQFSN